MAQKAKSSLSPWYALHASLSMQAEMFPGLAIQLGSVFSEKDLYGGNSCLNYISALGKMVSSVPLQGQLWGNICYSSLSLANRKSD